MRNFVLITCIILVSGCSELADRKPLMGDLTKQDMHTLVKPVPPLIRPKHTSPKVVPEYVPAIMNQPVSISLTEHSCLTMVIQEVARHAGVDLRLDPNIKAKVIYRATHVPFIKVIRAICEMANLKYRIDGNGIIIEKDVPYSQSYNVQFLNIDRNTESRIGSATDIFSDVGSKQGGGLSSGNGSQSEISSKTNNNFWKELEANLDIILKNSHPQGYYSIHKQAGILTIVATQKTQQLIKGLLNSIYRIANAQVVIEAKIVEVMLKDNFYNGINWSKIGQKSDWTVNVGLGDMAKASDIIKGSSTPSLLSFGLQGTQFSSIINTLEEFGTLRTISSPRLTVMNNQVAVLKVAQNQVYFKINYNKSLVGTTTTRENTSITSDVHTFPIGLVMTVQPAIDPESGMVTLFVRPTLTDSNQSVKDPSAEIAYNNSLVSGTTNNSVAFTPATIPVVDVREIESIMRLTDGEIAVMGGLMTSNSMQHNQGLPGLYNKPILENIFGAKSENNRLSELVILLRVRIVDADNVPYPDAADERLLAHVSDPRLQNSGGSIDSGCRA